FHMAERRDDAEEAGIGHKEIQFAPTIVNRAAETVDGGHIRQVERHQGRLTANGLDLVVQFFQPAGRACDGDDMRAGSGKSLGEKIANAARGACNQSDTPGKVESFSHGKRNVLLGIRGSGRNKPDAEERAVTPPAAWLGIMPTGCEK